MKKITAFFLLLLPIFITGLMFISGLIQSKSFQISVVGISISEGDQDIVWNKEDESSKPTFKFSAHVLPLNAKNQEIQWTISDDSIATVNDDGLVSIKNYGKVMVTATAVGNPSCRASREIDSFDYVVHEAKVANGYDIGYLSAGDLAKVNLTTSPSIDHAQKVESITYSLEDPSDTKLSIDKNSGIIKVNSTTTTGSSNVLAEVVTSYNGEKKKVVANTTINFGNPIDSLTWSENNTDETINELTCNLFSKITIGPADISNFSPTDFVYESDNKNVATVDEQGKVKFNQLRQNEYVTFTVAYKRNPDLKISKRIQSANVELKEIFFTQTKVEIPFNFIDSDEKFIPQSEESAPQDHPEYALYWYTYPRFPSSQIPPINIKSTNEDVVQPIKNAGGISLKINNPGKCALKIYICDENDNEISSDVCEVNITPCDLTKQNATPIKEDLVELTNGTAYYFLRNNIKCATTSTDPETISFEFIDDAGGKATIDENNILHFASDTECTAAIRVYVGQDTIGKKFDVKYSPGAIEPTTIGTETLKVDVGHLIKLNNAIPVIAGKYYEKYFDVVKDENGNIEYFIPKRGCDISDFEAKKNSGETIKFHLIVIEEPIYVKTQTDTLYTTDEEQVDFANTMAPEVFPSSATKSDGSVYKPSYSYQKDAGWIVEDNTINFNKVGTCKVDVDFGAINNLSTIKSTYFVRSTFHDDVGKFKVTKDDLTRTVMKQYDTWNTKDTLYIENVNASLVHKISITSTTGLCNPTVSRAGLWPFEYIEVKANPISGKYGNDVIKISSPTYTFFLKVNVKPTITDFTVTCKQDVWSELAVNTYTPTLKVRVTANTINKEADHDWKWSIDNGDKTSVDNASKEITLTLSNVGQHTLQLYDNSDNLIKSYIINKKDGLPKISLYGSNDSIYASCNSSSKSALLVTDGYVDDNFFDNGFEIEFSAKEEEKAEISKNIITISNIPDSLKEIYTNTLTLKYQGSEVAKFNVGRDIVSKIKLPRHNILDQSDRRGMQKVHVYGNKSHYNISDIKSRNATEVPGYGNEGEVNYYKVPVQLYGRNRQLLGNDMSAAEAKQLKLTALRNLNITIGRNSTFIISDDDNGDFIRVYFDKNDLYSPQEIYKDLFDTKTGKNIDFRVATKSNEVEANYKFVAVEGINVWTQEPVIQISKHKSEGLKNAMVLQKNFGVVSETTDENAIFNDTNFDNIGYVYGNGYCLDFKNITRETVFGQSKEFTPDIWVGLNVDINGADNETLMSRKGKIAFTLNDVDNYPSTRYFAYSIIHHLSDGLTMNYCDKEACFRNSIIHSILNQSIYMNSFEGGKVASLYLENCSFFNSASFPIMAVGPCPIRVKGNLGIYNFQDKEMLRHIAGQVDLTTLWPLVLQFARRNNMVHKDYKNDEVINSFMITALDSETYFWDFGINDWVKSTRGISGSGKYLAKYADISVRLPIVGEVGASMWGGTNPAFEPGAPRYEDEYDQDGRLKLSFINEQINRWSRQIKFF